MSTRVMVPLLIREGPSSRISDHFGRAPYFALIELRNDDVKIEIIENPKTLGYTPAQYAIVSGVEYVVVKGGIGVKAIQLLRGHGIKIIETSGETLDEVIEELKSGKLREYIGEGCPGKRWIEEYSGGGAY